MKKTLMALGFALPSLSAVPVSANTSPEEKPTPAANAPVEETAALVELSSQLIGETPEVAPVLEESKTNLEVLEKVVADSTEVEKTLENIAVDRGDAYNQLVQLQNKEEETKTSIEELKAAIEAKKQEKLFAEEEWWASRSTAVDHTVTGGLGNAGPIQFGEPTSNTYPWGQCTWGVKNLLPWVGPYWGDAHEWDNVAASLGHTVGYTPKVGAIAVWNSGGGGYGHVAVVTAVDGDKIQVMEANYGGSADAADPRGLGSYRGWFTDHSVVYIYPKA